MYAHDRDAASRLLWHSDDGACCYRLPGLVRVLNTLTSLLRLRCIDLPSTLCSIAPNRLDDPWLLPPFFRFKTFN